MRIRTATLITTDLMPNASITSAPFGTTEDGRQVDIFTLTNARGSEVRITPYGGTVVSIKVPDRDGVTGDVVLGFDTLADYERHNAFFGALIGRYANRVAKGRFKIGPIEYRLATNNGENHLHGGVVGFNRAVWDAEVSGPGLLLSYTSKDGDEGYPGNLNVEVVYSWTDEDELKIHYSAGTDQRTIVNLTNHSYFNLAGAGADSILDHELMIDADAYLPTDQGSIPTGEVRSVDGGPFDFRDPAAIGSRIGESDEQLEFGRGYDHNWVLNREGPEPSVAATVFERNSGRMMTVLTTEPGLQFYSGNFLDGSLKGKGGVEYPHRSALCLEAQHFPDSPNRSEFPSSILSPGETYRQTTIYRFEVR